MIIGITGHFFMTVFLEDIFWNIANTNIFLFKTNIAYAPYILLFSSLWLNFVVSISVYFPVPNFRGEERRGGVKFYFSAIFNKPFTLFIKSNFYKVLTCKDSSPLFFMDLDKFHQPTPAITAPPLPLGKGESMWYINSIIP